MPQGRVNPSAKASSRRCAVPVLPGMASPAWTGDPGGGDLEQRDLPSQLGKPQAQGQQAEPRATLSAAAQADGATLAWRRGLATRIQQQVSLPGIYRAAF